MRNGLFFKKVYRMQKVYRWKEEAPKFEDNAAAHSFRCAAFAMIAVLIEQQMFENKTLNGEKVVVRALLHDLNETATASIKHFTKKHPKVQRHIQVFESSANEEIVSNVSKSLRPYLHDAITLAEDESDEGRFVDEIDTFDSMMFCMRESKINSATYFKNKYEELRLVLEKTSHPSIDYLLKCVKNPITPEEKGMAELLDCVMSLDKVERWAKKFNTIDDNDATHTFRMSVIAVFNALVERYKVNTLIDKIETKKIDIFQLVGKCLFHDLIEAKTGDILGPLKHSSEEVKKAFEAYEKEMSEELIVQLPPSIQPMMKEFMIECKNDTFEGKMVDIADKIDALLKAKLEMRNNADEYKETYHRILETIQHQFEEKSVVFFLAYIVHDFEFGL